MTHEDFLADIKKELEFASLNPLFVRVFNEYRETTGYNALVIQMRFQIEGGLKEEVREKRYRPMLDLAKNTIEAICPIERLCIVRVETIAK
jgi:hypothetical protein